MRRTTVVAGGSAQWLARVTAGVRQTIVMKFRGPTLRTGPAITTRFTTLVNEKLGVSAVTRVVSALVKPAQATGVLQRIVATLPRMAQRTGPQITQTRITLTRRNGATTITQTAITGAGFANITNAQGTNNSTFSDLTGSAVAAQSGTLTGAYTDPVASKSNLSILSVKVYLYWKVVGDTLSTSVVTRAWKSTNIAQVALGTSSSGTISNLPEIFDITSTIAGNWANLNGFQAIFTGSTPLANLSVISLDAMELEIITNTLIN